MITPDAGEWTVVNRRGQEQKASDKAKADRLAEAQADNRTGGLDKYIYEEDIRNISRFRLSESGGAWTTDMSDEQLGQLTTWMRKRPVTPVGQRYPLEDDNIFDAGE
eukprot:7332214-Heterocapsa_arctica.AAC.1